MFRERSEEEEFVNSHNRFEQQNCHGLDEHFPLGGRITKVLQTRNPSTRSKPRNTMCSYAQTELRV